MLCRYLDEKGNCLKCTDRIEGCAKCLNNKCEECLYGFFLTPDHEICIECDYPSKSKISLNFNVIMKNDKCELCSSFVPDCKNC